MARAEARRIRRGAWLIVVLAAVAGAVDGIGFLVLLGMFTAHMSGNSVVMGASAGIGDWHRAVLHLFPIPIFIVGVVLGASLNEALARRGVHRLAAPALGLEAAALGLFVVAGHPLMRGGSLRPESEGLFFLLAAIPALAMGFQNATLRRVLGSPVRTTFITGTLTGVGEDTAKYLFWVRDHCGRRRLGVLLRLATRHAAVNRAAMGMGLWLGYVVGAVAGAAAQKEWGLLALSGAIVGLAAVAMMDAWRPLGEKK